MRKLRLFVSALCVLARQRQFFNPIPEVRRMGVRPSSRRPMRKAISSAGFFVLNGWMLLCTAGCNSQPARPSAADLAGLKTKCGEDGLEFSGISGGGDRYISHFNEQTRRCYLEQIAPLTDEKVVYAAENHRMLAEIREDKTGSTGIVVSDDGTPTYSYDAAKEKLKELMQEDLQ
jgi:hypothetical protein